MANKSNSFATFIAPTSNINTSKNYLRTQLTVPELPACGTSNSPPFLVPKRVKRKEHLNKIRIGGEKTRVDFETNIGEDNTAEKKFSFKYTSSFSQKAPKKLVLYT